MILVGILGIVLISVSYMVIFSPEEIRTEYPIPITDALGRQVTIEEIPERIVSAAPANTEIVFALGLGEKVVGVTDWCDWPSEMVSMRDNGTIESVGDYWEPSIERIIDLEPDLVVLSEGVPYHALVAEQLGHMDIKCFVTWKGGNLTEIYQNIEILGKICDRIDAASDLIESMKDRVDAVENVIAGQGPITMLHAVWLNPVFTCGGDTFVSEVITLAGGENIFADLNGWPTVSIEQVVASQPQVITITATMMFSNPEDILQMLEDDPLWSEVPAVQNGKVYILLDEGENIFSRQSVRIVDAMELLAEILYPEAFGITVPNVIGNDYMDYLSSQTSGSVTTALEMQGSVGYV